MIVTFADLLAWGDADELGERLASMPEIERLHALKPLVGRARKILAAAHASLDQNWWGKLNDNHCRAATMVLYSSKAYLLRHVPVDPTFITQDIPYLFPHDLQEILLAWAELYLKNPKKHDRNAALVHAVAWIPEQGLTSIEVTRALALLILTGSQSPVYLYAWLHRYPELARSVIKTACEEPGVKGASLAQVDSVLSPAESIRQFLIPNLIAHEILLSGEVLTWCQLALNTPGRSNYEKTWFRALRQDLQSL